MIEGTLIINLDPPYIGFAHQDNYINNSQKKHSWRHCSLDEIKDLLVELQVVSSQQHWPLRECVLRLPLRVPKSVMVRLGLASQ